MDYSTTGVVECWAAQTDFSTFAVAGHHGDLLQAEQITQYKSLFYFGLKTQL
ncbi:MAG: hypothetical protein KH704_06565 [Clostridiales bacterium]|nr:hypothetical protein [Clostridiales bacterium]